MVSSVSNSFWFHLKRPQIGFGKEVESGEWCTLYSTVEREREWCRGERERETWKWPQIELNQNGHVCIFANIYYWVNLHVAILIDFSFRDNRKILLNFGEYIIVPTLFAKDANLNLAETSTAINTTTALNANVK